MTVKLVLVIATSLIIRVRSSRLVVMEMASGFMKPLNECKKDFPVTDSVKNDFKHFWKDDYEPKDIHTGCVLICLAQKAQLIDENFTIVHSRFKSFFKAYGANGPKAGELADILNGCTNNIEMTFLKICINGLTVAKCFKKEIKDRDWTPNFRAITTPASGR